MIKKPPAAYVSENGSAFSDVTEKYPDKIQDYLNYYQPVDDKGRYLPFDEFRYRVKPELDIKLAWAIKRSSRRSQAMTIYVLDDSPKLCDLVLTPTIQKAVSHADRHTTTGALEFMSNKIGEEKHLKYLLNDLIEDEAISSSQLEGAATTTIAAKEMINRKRKPRTIDEKMIVGNYKMMQFAWDNRKEPLSIDLILNMHKSGTEDIDNDKYTPAVFRQADDVFVADANGDTLHTPPLAASIESRLGVLIRWANKCHDEADSSEYIHPMVKAIALHFAIGYEHPFRDGNGRVARSLFYWYMFKNNYAAFRYIAISTLLKAAPVKYGKSYLYTETDEMDLTYFIEYQCSVVLRAIDNFRNAYDKSLKDIEAFNVWVWESGLYNKLNENQKTVFQVAKGNSGKVFTIVEAQNNLGCSYNTASSVLKGLHTLGVFDKYKVGKIWHFKMLGNKEIQSNWKAN